MVSLNVSSSVRNECHEDVKMSTTLVPSVLKLVKASVLILLQSPFACI